MEFIVVLIIFVVVFNVISENKNSNSEVKESELPPIEPQKFVKVIFRKGDNKMYDYFLGDNYNIQIGDFVEVWAHGKFSDRDELKIVQVVYISKPGEISYKANKTIVKKSDYRKW